MSITVQPIETDGALTKDERDLIADAQADVLATFLRHPLDLNGDIAVLSAVVGYHQRRPDDRRHAPLPRGTRRRACPGSLAGLAREGHRRGTARHRPRPRVRRADQG